MGSQVWLVTCILDHSLDPLADNLAYIRMLINYPGYGRSRNPAAACDLLQCEVRIRRGGHSLHQFLRALPNSWGAIRKLKVFNGSNLDIKGVISRYIHKKLGALPTSVASLYHPKLKVNCKLSSQIMTDDTPSVLSAYPNTTLGFSRQFTP